MITHQCVRTDLTADTAEPLAMEVLEPERDTVLPAESCGAPDFGAALGAEVDAVAFAGPVWAGCPDWEGLAAAAGCWGVRGPPCSISFKMAASLLFFCETK